MIAIKVPPLGESIVEATVSRWLKQEGDAVTAGETLVELETDKITVEVPALKSGILSSRARAEGDVVGVDDVLGQLDESGTGAVGGGAMASIAAEPPPGGPHDPGDGGPLPFPTIAMAAAEPPPGGPHDPGDGGPLPFPTIAMAAAEPPPGGPHDPGDGGPVPVPTMAAMRAAPPVKASPAATRTADAAGVNIATVPGTGRGGVVSKPDVVNAIAAGSAAPPKAPAPPAPAPAPVRTGERETREKMTTRRKRIAENLLQAQHNTAHLTTFNEIDMSAVTALRARIKDKVEKDQGVKLSFMPFFVKAASSWRSRRTRSSTRRSTATASSTSTT